MPGLYTGANGLWGGFSGLIYGSSALSTPPGLLADASGGFSPASLFASGEQGAWYDPSDFSTMFQDAAGTTPVTAIEQPVGLLLDKSRGLIPGPELVTNGTFASGVTTGWAAVNGSTLSVVDGSLRVTNAAVNFGAAQQIVTTVIGRTYKLTFTVGAQTGTSSAWIGSTLGGFDYRDFDFIVSGTYTLIFTATTTTTYLRFQNRQTTIGNISDFDNISVYELPGNHAYQATNAARPILKQDAQSKYFLQFDGTNTLMQSLAFTMPGPYSVWAGVRTNVGNLQLIVNSDFANDMPQYLRLNLSRVESIAFSSGGTFTSVGQSINTADNFVASANCSTTSLEVFVNGTSSGPLAVTGTLNSVSRPLVLGSYSVAGFSLNGRIYGVILRGATSTPSQMTATQIWMSGKTGVPATPPDDLLGNEWQGLAINFQTNTYEVRIATGSEQLTGTGPDTIEVSLGVDFTQNNYTMVV